MLVLKMTHVVNMISGPLRGLHHTVREQSSTESTLNYEVTNYEVMNYEVLYELSSHNQSVDLSDAVGKSIRIVFAGHRSCVHCGRSVRKLYQNGYCFPCVTTLAECDLCIVKPHECHYHLGTCRDPKFGDAQCMIPHYVYLADSSGVKVGLTRKGRQLTRWVDQGATSALLLAEVPVRKLAGELEMEVAKRLPDKTDWRKMLTDTGADDVDLQTIRDQVVEGLNMDYRRYILKQSTQVNRFHYTRSEAWTPILKSISLDKQPILEAVVRGVKGQYLLLDNGVFNVRKHAGYHVEVELLED